MTWWQILIMVLGVGGGVSVLTWLLTRKKQPVAVDREALQETEREYYEAKAQYHAEESKKLKATNEELDKKLAEHKIWLETKKEELKNEFQKDYEHLSADSKLLIERLDAVLGSGPEPE